MSDYKALYRKWRPQTFDDVCGQDAITDILKYEVESGKLSHAYLFCGSRGTGKTTCAKILAKAVNCTSPENGNPCNKCEACRSIDSGISTDVMELDAASNTGVDNVRNMKDEIAFTPSELKYRVYIIDEIHMMSISAFNALLKTLEEPPEYVIFILATTEFHKLPTTIVSRCQRFDFKRISSDIIINRLKHIANLENIDITDDAARVIARVSRGGMRDAISLLELCAGAHKQIDDNLVFETVGSGNRENAYKVIEAISKSDCKTIYKIISEIVMSSGDLSVFWQELIDSYRDIMVVKSADDAKSYLDLTDVENSTLKKISASYTMAKLFYHVSVLERGLEDMQRAFNSKRSIAEIALTKMCDPTLSSSNESLALRVEELERELSMLKFGGAYSMPIIDKDSQEQSSPSISEANAQIPKAAYQNTVTDKICEYDNWIKVLEKVSELKKALSARFIGAKAYKINNVEFLIRMNSFFAKNLMENESDMLLLRGIISNIEGLSRDDVRIKIEPLDKGKDSDTFSELENAFK